MPKPWRAAPGLGPLTPGRVNKQLLECTTLSISINRITIPRRALGFINPKGFSNGTRTIAGSMILTQFTTDVLLRFLASTMMAEVSKDTTYTKVDQLPPMNLTLLFCDEYGYASYQRLLGVRFVMDAVVYSTSDMYTEKQITYMANDLTPLMLLVGRSPLPGDTRGPKHFALARLAASFQLGHRYRSLTSRASSLRQRTPVCGEDTGERKHFVLARPGVRAGLVHHSERHQPWQIPTATRVSDDAAAEQRAERLH